MQKSIIHEDINISRASLCSGHIWQPPRHGVIIKHTVERLSSQASEWINILMHWVLHIFNIFSMIDLLLDRCSWIFIVVTSWWNEAGRLQQKTNTKYHFIIQTYDTWWLMWLALCILAVYCWGCGSISLFILAACVVEAPWLNKRAYSCCRCMGRYLGAVIVLILSVYQRYAFMNAFM